jgi:methyl-accepting chemotaxis protein
MFKKITIVTKIGLLVALFFCGLVLFAVISLNTLSQLKVNGPLYKTIVQGKDLIADILPPPEYIIESYLSVFQIYFEKEPAMRQALIEKIKALRSDYVTRHQFWQEHLQDSAMRDALLRDSYEPAMRFYQRVEDQYIPLLERGDEAAANAMLNGELKQLYLEHRRHIDQVVALATAANEVNEKDAAVQIQQSGGFLAGLSLVLLIVVSATGIMIAGDVRKIMQAMNNAMHNLHEGQLNMQIIGNFSGEGALLQKAVNEGVGALKNAIASCKETLTGVASDASQVAAASVSFSDNFATQAASLQQTAAAVEQITATIEGVSQITAQTAKHARDSAQNTHRGIAALDQMNATMNTLNCSGTQIAAVVEVVNEIAFQTNLLALNAAVEAARAGEQGRGFAVVANEVRKLAGKSADSVKQIRTLIETNQINTENAVKAAAATQMILQEVMIQIDQVSQAMNDLEQRSREQSGGIQQVNVAVIQMDQMTQHNVGIVQSLAQLSEKLYKEVQGSMQQLNQFKV